MFTPTPAEPRFWTRTKVALAAGALGLVAGAGLGAAGGDVAATTASDPVTTTTTATATITATSEPSPTVDQGAVDAAVVSATADLRDRLAQQRDDAHARLTKVQTAANNAIAAARRETRAVKRKAAQQVADAQAQAQAAAAAPPPAEDALDPHFGTCGEANAAGYGPYVEGQDPEYDWYEDRDGDGVDCEF